MPATLLGPDLRLILNGVGFGVLGVNPIFETR
jgi:hypothetical protein